MEQPKIFKLYESNIGLVVPLIADQLIKAESTYPMEWIEKAFGIAVERNARSWRYIEAILKRWSVDGFQDKKQPVRRDSEEGRNRYAEWEG